MQQAVLQHHLYLLHLQRTDQGYGDYLITKVVPLFRLIYPDLTAVWGVAKADYLRDCEQLKQSCLSEIKDTFIAIKQKLVDVDLLNEPSIQESCHALETILRFVPEEARVWVMPAQYEVATDRLKNLFYTIVALKREDIVRDYVESFFYGAKYVDDHDSELIYECTKCFKVIREKSLARVQNFSAEGTLCFYCPLCSSLLQRQPRFVLRQVVTIEFFNENKFVPSFFKLAKLHTAFSTSAAGAWEILCTIEWCWPIDKRRDFFRKNLLYEDIQACERSVFLLKLNNARIETRAIKENQKNKIHIFTRQYIASALKVVLDDLIPNCDLDQAGKFHGPDSIELVLKNHIQLQLRVTWAAGIIEICHVRSFHDDENIRCMFFKDLINNPGIFVRLSTESVSGADAKKYLREARMGGILGKLFIKYVTLQGAILKNNSLDLTGIPDSILKKLQNKLQQLDTIEWREKP